MITYEYECGSCGHRFEEIQSINDEPVKTCPKCGKEPHRLISGGSGFIAPRSAGGPPGDGWEPVKPGEDPWAKIGLPSGCPSCSCNGSCGIDDGSNDA
jgi:putative FmdB family regulatory protein